MLRRILRALPLASALLLALGALLRFGDLRVPSASPIERPEPLVDGVSTSSPSERP